MATTSARASLFVDTNIVVRANVESAPYHSESLTALRQSQAEGVILWISRQVLREYLATVTRDQTFMKALTPDVARERVEYFETHFRVADDHASVTANLLTLLVAVPCGGKQVHDANIVATMQTYGISHLLTLNTVDFVRFGTYIKVMSLADVVKPS